MSTSQNLKNQGNLSQGRDQSSPNRYPGPLDSTSPVIPKPGQSLRTVPPPQTRSNPNYSRPPAHSPLLGGNKSAALKDVKGVISDPEDESYRSRTNTEEEAGVGSRREIIGHEGDSEYDHRSEGTENEGQTPKNLVSLSESLKAMKSLRSNFQSFEYEIEAQQRKQGEKIYKEVDEDDYVNVMSAEEIEEEHEEEHDEEREEDQEEEDTYEEEEPERGSANARREIRGHYIEEIHEELHEESPRKELRTEENEEDEKSQDEIKQEDQEERHHYQEQEQEQELEDQENKEKTTEESEIVAKEEPRQEEEIEEKSHEQEDKQIQKQEPKEEENKVEDKQKEDVDKEEGINIKKEVKEGQASSENKVELTETQAWGITEIDPEEDIRPPPKTLPVTKDPEEAIIKHQTENLPKISTESIKSPTIESHPPVSSASRVEEEKKRFLDELEFGDVKPSEPVKQEVPELKPPKVQEEEPPKKIETELPPPKTQEEVPPKKVENIELPPPKTQEELPPKKEENIELPPPKKEENIELPPPKMVSEPKEQGHRDQGTKLTTSMRSKEREMVQKPKPMFIPAAQNIGAPFQPKVQEKLQEKVPTPVLEPESDVKHPEDPSLLVRFKKMEIELKKEKKKNEHLEEEKETILSENRNLKQELEELRAKLETQNQNQPSEEVVQKEQETVEKLRLELKSTIENSRLINEHSNKIINESVKYKQEIEIIINTLEEEKKQLQQTIIELKNQAHEQSLKVEGFQQKAEFFERKASEYEESFDLIQRQIKERTETVQKLTSLHDNSQSALQSLPRVEDLLQKLQPECQSVAVQTTQTQLPVSQTQSPFPKGASDLNTSPFALKTQSVVPPTKEESPAKPEIFKPKAGPLTVEKKVEAEKPKDVSSSQKGKALVFNLDQELKTPQKSEEPVKTIKTDKPVKEEPKQTRVSQDLDDLSLLLGTETAVGKVSAPKVITKTSKEPLKIGGTSFSSQKEKPIEIKPAKVEEEKSKEPELIKEKEKSVRESTENKSIFESNIKSATKEPVKPSTVNISQDLKSLPKEKEDQSIKKSLETVNLSSWGIEEPEIIEPRKSIEETKHKEEIKTKHEIKPEEPVTEKPVKTGMKLQTPKEEEPKVTPKAEETVVKKPALNLPQGKSMVPNFNKPTITKESEKKSVQAPLILSKANPSDSEKSGSITNLGGTSNKAGARYSQTNKGFAQNTMSTDADNFFDELGLSESPGVRGSNQFKSGGLMRESTTSIKSVTSQKGQDTSSQTAAKKKPLIINQFK